MEEYTTPEAGLVAGRATESPDCAGGLQVGGQAGRPLGLVLRDEGPGTDGGEARVLGSL